MEKTFTQQVQTLHILFENGFADAYRSANARKRRRVMPYLSALYRRWYYSALIENTPFSPANIMESICAHYGEDTATYPIPQLRSRIKFSGFDIQCRAYSAQNHGVTDDLKRLMDFCTPYIDLQEGNYFFDEQMFNLAETLTLADPAYAAFLLEVALKMKLLVKTPALYVNRAQPARDCKARFEAGAESLFKEIVEASFSVCAVNLTELIAIPEPIFTESSVRAMLAEPVETDAIFERVYDILGYTLEDLVELSMGTEELDFDSPDGAFLAGTFMMGVVLDQYFFTPFGHYLKLIRPIYVLPFDFAGEIDDFIGNRTDKADDYFIAFFAPCSHYTLTDLGLEVLNVRANEMNYYNVKKYLPFSLLKDSLFADSDMIETLIKMAQLLPLSELSLSMREVYTFRVRLASDPAQWLHLYMPANTTLADIYTAVAEYFPIRENHDYSFFHDAVENRFAEYPSVKRSGPRSRKTAVTPLEALDFGHQNKLILAAYRQALPFGGEPSTVRFELEMMGRRPGSPDNLHPRVVRISKALQATFDKDNLEEE